MFLAIGDSIEFSLTQAELASGADIFQNGIPLYKQVTLKEELAWVRRHLVTSNDITVTCSDKQTAFPPAGKMQDLVTARCYKHAVSLCAYGFSPCLDMNRQDGRPWDKTGHTELHC